MRFIFLFVSLFIFSSLFCKADVTLWPLYYQNKENLEVFWPLYAQEKTKNYTVRKFISFNQHYPSDFSQQFYCLWPLSGCRWNEKQFSSWIFPCLWAGYHSSDTLWHGIFPLWVYHQKRDHKYLNVAILSSNSWSKNRWSYDVFPLIWTDRTLTEHHDDFSYMLFPVISHSSRHYLDPNKKDAVDRGLWGNFLLAYWSQNIHECLQKKNWAYASDYSAGGLFPMAHFSRRMNARYLTQNDMHTPKVSFSSLNWFLLWYNKTNDHVLDINPEQTVQAIKEEATAPGKKHYPELKKSLFAPLYYQKKSWQYQEHDVLATKNRPGVRSNLCEPIRYDDDFWLFPYGSSFSQTPETCRLVRSFLLLGYMRDSIQKSTIETIAADSKEEEKRCSFERKKKYEFWPLYLQKKEQTWHAEQKKSHDNTLLDRDCAYDASADELISDYQMLWLFPFYKSKYADQKGKGSAFCIPPLYVSNSEGGDVTSYSRYFLLGGWGGSKNKTMQEAQESYHYLLPFYFRDWQKGDFNKADPELTKSRLWLLPYWYSYRKRSTTTRYKHYFWPLYFNKDVEHLSDSTLIPLLFWSQESQRGGKAGKTISTTPDVSCCADNRDCPLSSGVSFHAEKSQFVTPLCYGEKTTMSNQSIFFPFYFYEKRVTGDSSLTLPWLLGGFTKRVEYSEPLFGNSWVGKDERNRPQRIDKSQAIFWPLYCRETKTTEADRVTANNYSYMRFFPLFRYEKNKDNLITYSWLPLYSYKHIFAYNNPDESTVQFSFPWHWLPLFQYRHQETTDGDKKRSWLFPFYGWEEDESTDFYRFSLFYFLWQRELQRGESRTWGLGGGLLNYSATDINGFEDERLLYRVYRKYECSWYQELQFMPFYDQRVQENGSHQWNFLGGLFGAGRDKNTSWFKILYIPFRHKIATELQVDAEVFRLKNAPKHLAYALKYAEAGRYDRAVVEFDFARGTFETNAAVLVKAANAYKNVSSQRFDEYFRADLFGPLKKEASFGERFRKNSLQKDLWKKAIAYYRQAIAAGADEKEMLKNCALCFMKLNDRAKTEKTLTERANKFPGDACRMDLFLWQWITKHPSYAYGDLSSQKQKLKELQNFEKTVSEYALLVYMEARLMKNIEQSEAQKKYAEQMQKNRLDALMTVEEQKAVQLKRLECRLECSAAILNGTALPLFLHCAEMPISDTPLMIHENEFWDSCRYDYRFDNVLSCDQLCNAKKRFFLSDKAVQEAYELCRRVDIPMDQQCGDYAELKKKTQALRVARFEIEIPLLPKLKVNQFSWWLGSFAEDYDSTDCVKRLLGVLENRIRPLLASEGCLYSAEKLEKLEDARVECRNKLAWLKNWHALRIDAGATDAQRRSRPCITRYDNGYVDVDAAFGGVDHCEIQVVTHFNMPEDQPAEMLFGFDDFAKVYLNDQLLRFDSFSNRIAQPDEFSTPVLLKKGKNTVVIFLRNHTLGCGFFLRFKDATGHVIYNPNWQ